MEIQMYYCYMGIYSASGYWLTAVFIVAEICICEETRASGENRRSTGIINQIYARIHGQIFFQIMMQNVKSMSILSWLLSSHWNTYTS
jgi:hypothetical protein